MSEKIRVQTIIEVAGKPIENVRKVLEHVEEKLKEEKENFKCVSSHIGNPELDDKTTLFGGFLECELEFSFPNKIITFIVDYTPTSIEVLEPKDIQLDSQEFTGLLNDISQILLRKENEIRKLKAYIHHLKVK